MFLSRDKLCTRVVIIAAILFYANTASSADEDSEPNEDTTDETVEEITVYAYKSGDKIDMDARYEELLRSQIAAELDRMEVLNEEYEWRKSSAAVENTSRIKWGYDLESDMSMRRDTTFTDLPTDTVKPATLFRVQY